MYDEEAYDDGYRDAVNGMGNLATDVEWGHDGDEAAYWYARGYHDALQFMQRIEDDSCAILA
jgi:hypothetical protein